MQKNTKYFLLSLLLTAAFIIPDSFAFAQTPPDIQYVKGASCGASGQGKCKKYCDPYENIDASGPISASGVGECGLSDRGESLTCCVPTHCGSNSTGVGKCTSDSSCPGTSIIGAPTSDCQPPKLCCIIPAVPNQVDRNAEFSVPNGSNQTNQNQTNPFTGQNSQLAPAAPEGATGGLVPCTGLDCSLCDILVLIKNIINFLMGAIFALAGGFVVWGAIEIMTSGGDEGKVSSGRGRITTAIYGIAFALGAWLFIGTLLQVLTNSPSVLPWNSIQCSSPSLKLTPIPKTGNDNACTSIGGTCQDTSVTCDSGIWEKGKCLSSNNENYQCCMPSTNYSCQTPYQCLNASDATNYETVSGKTCPTGQECVDKSKIVSPGLAPGPQ
jgi:hypothetical protein